MEAGAGWGELFGALNPKHKYTNIKAGACWVWSGKVFEASTEKCLRPQLKGCCCCSQQPVSHCCTADHPPPVAFSFSIEIQTCRFPTSCCCTTCCFDVKRDLSKNQYKAKHIREGCKKRKFNYWIWQFLGPLGPRGPLRVPSIPALPLARAFMPKIQISSTVLIENLCSCLNPTPLP